MSVQSNTPNYSDEKYNNTFKKSYSLPFVDKIDDILKITDNTEMEAKINENIINIMCTFQYFCKSLRDKTKISKEEITSFIHCLKFLDTLNLFMSTQSINALTSQMHEIEDLVKQSYYFEYKEDILKQIKYTEMTVITLKKKIFKSMFFGDGSNLAKEIEHNLEQVCKNGKFDQKLFKQIQNLFYVVQSKIEETKRSELQQKLNEMKVQSIQYKKQRYINNAYSSEGNYYEEYNDYSDFKNYSNVSGNLYDYNENFYESKQYHDKNNANDYTSGYLGYQDNRYFYGRHPHRSQTGGGYYRKHFENEEKEVEISSSYPKQEDTKPKANDIEIIQSVVPSSQSKNYYAGNNDYYHHRKGSSNYMNPVNNNSQMNNNQSSISSNQQGNTTTNLLAPSGQGNNSTQTNKQYTPGFKKKIITKKNQKQRNTTLVEVPPPNEVVVVEKNDNTNTNTNANTNKNKGEVKEIQGEQINNDTPKNSQSSIDDIKPKESKMDLKDTEIITTVVNTRENKQHGKYYHSNSGYKNLSYGKNLYYNNYSGYYHRGNENYYHGRDTYQIGGNMGGSGTDTSGGYYNKRNPQQQKKYHMGMNQKSKHDFVEIDDIPQHQFASNAIELNDQTVKRDLVEIGDDFAKEKKSEQEEKNDKHLPIEEIVPHETPKEENANEVHIEDTEIIHKEKEEITKIDDIIKQDKAEEDKAKIELDFNIDAIKKAENNIVVNNNNQINEIAPNEIKELNNLNTSEKEELKENDIFLNDDHGSSKEPNDNNEMDFQQNFILNSSQEKDNKDDKDDNDNLLEQNQEGLINEFEEDEEGEESSDSVTNEEIQAEFQKFISETQPGAHGQDDNYYIDESNMKKNNKIVFEDEDILEENIKLAQEILNQQIKTPNDESPNEEDNKEIIEEEELNLNTIAEQMNQISQHVKEIPEGNEEEDEVNKDINIHEEMKKEEVNNKEETQKQKEDDNTLIKHEQHKGNFFIDSVKSVDPKIISTIKNKISEEYNIQEIKKKTAASFIYYQNSFPPGNTQIFSPVLLAIMKNYQRQFVNTKAPLQNIFMNYYSHFLYRKRDSNIHRDYIALKSQQLENPNLIWTNLTNFENKILIPLYQRITYNANKKRNIYYITFWKYKKLIQRILAKEKVIKKVKPYGSYMNNFLIDSGDIDICIVPKCNILDFASSLEKIKGEIVNRGYGEHKLSHHTGRYLLLRILDNQTKFIIDITVHTMLPILNTNLVRLYSLYDQRFHIMGLYVKHWAKINKIHGAADNFLSSYALILMIIHFLQKIVDPRVLPNLQKIEANKEINYEYLYNGEMHKTNIYYEEDLSKIKSYMSKINNGKENKETATNLLIKFFEYYSYYFDSEQRISINKELHESMKQKPDNIAFSIEDPFDKQHNPGKSMTVNSLQYNKFLTGMKKEINYILNGEYVKRIDKIISSGNNQPI